MSSRKQDCAFLDSSILISHFLGNFKKKIDKLLNIKARYGLPCYLSSSVEDECTEKMKEALDNLGKNMTLLRMHIAGEKTRTEHEILLTEPDILMMELLFNDRFKELSEEARLKGREEPPEMEQRMLRTLEGSFIEFLEGEFREKASIPMEETEIFLAESLKGFNEIKDAFALERRALTQKFDVSPDQALVEQIMKIGIPKKDSLHIASAMKCASEKSLSLVFVSVDYKHIIRHQEELYKQFKFQVCDPIYAYHHLRNEDSFKGLVDSRSQQSKTAVGVLTGPQVNEPQAPSTKA